MVLLVRTRSDTSKRIHKCLGSAGRKPGPTSRSTHSLDLGSDVFEGFILLNCPTEITQQSQIGLNSGARSQISVKFANVYSTARSQTATVGRLLSTNLRRTGRVPMHVSSSFHNCRRDSNASLPTSPHTSWSFHDAVIRLIGLPNERFPLKVPVPSLQTPRQRQASWPLCG